MPLKHFPKPFTNQFELNFVYVFAITNITRGISCEALILFGA